MSSNFKLIYFLLEPLAALLRRIGQSSASAPEEDQLDSSIISISANKLHF